jgi:hypothetical protein
LGKDREFPGVAIFWERLFQVWDEADFELIILVVHSNSSLGILIGYQDSGNHRVVAHLSEPPLPPPRNVLQLFERYLEPI